jgi:hypothetical protein
MTIGTVWYAARGESRVESGLDWPRIIIYTIPDGTKIPNVYDFSEPIRHCPRRGSAGGWKSEGRKGCIG